MKIKKLIKKYNLFSGTQVIIMPHNSVVVGVDYERTCEYIFNSVEYIGNCKSKDPGATAYHVFELIK